MEWKEIYAQWKNYDELDDSVKTSLEHIETDEDLLKDAFYAPLEFGTAGMRGIIGAGINRMNIYTVRQATEGLATFIEELGAEAKRQGVAIAYDSRHKSPEFAMESAKTLAAHGITSYVFESLRPTPELSFAVRELNCIAGIMITASHNPPEYNGYKVYGEDGGQMPPQDADAVTSYVRQVENPLLVRVLNERDAEDFINIIGEQIDTAYLKQLESVTIDKELIARTGGDLKLVYTPLHGTGKMLGEKALKQAGFNSFLLVPEQAEADPDFSTVKSPNPEEHSAFEYAIRLGEKEQADLLVATDPDADRLGAAVRLPDGSYQVLTGNQLGALMIHYLLSAHQKQGTLPANAVVLKSIVSSELATAICHEFGVKMENVLTGFKFIAEKIKEYEQTKQQTFVFGFEESYGYLVKPFVRDKDAIQALVLLAEIAAYYKEKDMTLYDGIRQIFDKYGYYQEKTISVTMNGISGLEKIKQLMSGLRASSPSEFAGIAVDSVEDYDSQIHRHADGSSEKIPLPSSNVLKYHLTDGSWIAVRPSGTEPKIKFYIGVKAESEQAAADKIAALTDALHQHTEQ
ncbi:phospho-sugar mutase [Vagococcus acidifermentans]|uniref:Phosphoglucomutase n=1 Tax=Vagococcus acidifermentans TaxID=564710 RepID=A0A430AXU7_9ENTE|nr:phospho-sugar mutase [Vagococcus acidifermentans]RSU12887.1 phosphoglucomutase [Vagococcus acidifermentans]